MSIIPRPPPTEISTHVDTTNDLLVATAPPPIRLEPGAKTSCEIEIENRGPSIVLTKYASSCECVRVRMTLAGIEVPSNGKAKIPIDIDFSDDPEYVGGLAPEIDLWGAGLPAPFKVSLDIEVAKP